MTLPNGIALSERDGVSSESSSRSIFLFEHDLFRKTGVHFSGSCSRSRVSFCSGDALAPLARDKMISPFTLRPYRTEDEDAAIALWRHTWQVAYPAIDFAA